MFLIEDHDRVGHNADDDRGHSVQHVGRKANDVAEAVASVLREVDTGAHSHRHSQNTGQGQDESRANDSVGHSAAGFANRFRGLREKGPVNRADTAVDQIGEDREQGHQHQDDREHGHAGHHMVGAAAPQSDGRDAVERGNLASIRHSPSKAGRG